MFDPPRLITDVLPRTAPDFVADLPQNPKRRRVKRDLSEFASDRPSRRPTQSPLVVVDHCLSGSAEKLSLVFKRCIGLEGLRLSSHASDADVFLGAVRHNAQIIITADRRNSRRNDLSRIAQIAAENTILARAQQVFTQGHVADITNKRLLQGLHYVYESLQTGELRQDLLAQPLILHVDQRQITKLSGGSSIQESVKSLCRASASAIHKAYRSDTRKSYCALLTEGGVQSGPSFRMLFAQAMYQNAPNLLGQGSFSDLSASPDAGHAKARMRQSLERLLGWQVVDTIRIPFYTNYASQFAPTHGIRLGCDFIS